MSTLLETTTSPIAPVPSNVLETPPASPEQAARHFAARLSVETDPWDVHDDQKRGVSQYTIVDSRGAEAFTAFHIPGALSLPHRTITSERMQSFPPNTIFVVYCWGPACNAAQKACAKLAALGFRVKEMIGGIEYWVREGYPTEGESLLGPETSLCG